MHTPNATFSILERIDVGETFPNGEEEIAPYGLSVSSNGSTWVKLFLLQRQISAKSFFQYPRTDRRG